MEINKKEQTIWNIFAEREKLTPQQLELFQKYAYMLIEWNKKFNLTAITGLQEIVTKHFIDSLALRKYVDLNNVKSIGDIGAGAGFPGVPLNIVYPDLGVILIEVNHKKIQFLEALIAQLGLKNIEICDLDWRTFLRKTESEVEYFVSRATMDPAELCRMFKPSCPYKNSKLVYWATSKFEIDKKLQEFVLDTKEYSLGYADRKLIFFGLKK
ncbi:TPA: 16S rRNA (guanine(527)-N(7))-methyltransferase RsmG [Candidatus Dependentiae bacterium]|nr:MAG: Ribosomal RNA small subunit methyltransferase G [candidate division TM6 bacterium GW2011_GWE2_31_21]KKP53004.1 MAG: Ribosomal RNA small subunit methyltransferase G [candidate division TM6 bacterium GW2011_GWF2_33_332]HBS47759.1 16S rRNA (guanine(527)-N(7))-methyltransferase RsmG [Candidatus Dependentiae bacterium]HBZ73265.1 16S rRNA (guanine(527)-N(7))-methyltransferase RsmG [Candidatus Dependentiae bacterium]